MGLHGLNNNQFNAHFVAIVFEQGELTAGVFVDMQ
jgi:hypothetical protein